MRWLETQGKHDKVIGALKKIASMNKKPLPDIPPTNTQTEVILKSNNIRRMLCAVFSYVMNMLYFNYQTN